MITFGSRGSDLALTQSRQVAEDVKQRTGEDYEIVVMQTAGDRIQDKPLSGIGIKGLFTRELEDALRSGAIDAATHSLKDLPVEDPEGLAIGAIPARENPADVLLAHPDAIAGEAGDLLQRLREGTRLGTSSPRRALAAGTTRNDLDIADIRGNVPTRADKARRGEYGAVVLAAAGLNRLAQDTSGLVTEELPVTSFTPAPGQGALGVQCRKDDARIRAALQTIHCETTASCANNERAVLLGLGGGCSMPLGVLVDPIGDRFRMRAALFGGEPTGALRAAMIGDDPEQLAQRLVDAWLPLIGNPLQGRRIATIRPDGDRTGLAAAMAIAGADVHSLAFTSASPIAASADELAPVLDADALAFTSARAVQHFVRLCRQHDREPFARPVFAVGPNTLTELVQLGCTDLHAADGRGGSSLARFCEQAGFTGKAIGMPCASDRHPGFERTATELGITVRALPVYELQQVEARDEIPTELDAFVFTSPSAVDAWLSAQPGRTDLPAIAIGDTTTASLAERGFANVTTLPEPTPRALIAALDNGATGNA